MIYINLFYENIKDKIDHWNIFLMKWYGYILYLLYIVDKSFKIITTIFIIFVKHLNLNISLIKFAYIFKINAAENKFY